MYNLNYDDWMKLSADSEVLEVTESEGKYWHRFRDTVFFAEGGGMVSDTGTINDLTVRDLKTDDQEQVWHLLDEKLEGSVHMEVDEWQRRSKVQIHTAGHLISAVAGKLYQVVTASFSNSDEESIEELTFTTCDNAILKELEAVCNSYIRDDLSIEIRYPSHEEAIQHIHEDEEIDRDHLRAVLIGDIDYSFCGCIHVPSLGKIQAIKFLGFEKTTRGYKLRYVCGEQLLQMYGLHYQALSDSAKSLGVAQLNLKAGIDKLHSEVKASKNEANNWKQQVIELKAKIMHEEAALPCLFHEFDDMDIKTFQSFCSYFVRTYEHGIFFLCKAEDRCHVMISHSKSFTYPCNELFKKLSAEHGLRGGGNPSMAQGGGEYSEALVNALKALCDEQNQ